MVLSVDVRSSSVRACFYDTRGERVDSTGSRRPHRFAFSAGGVAESDTDTLAGLVEACIDESFQRLEPDSRIIAVAFCTFLHGLIGTDGEGAALTPVFTWADVRSAAQAARLRTGWIRRRCSSGRAALCTPSTFPPRFSGFRKTGPGFTGRSAGGAPSGSTAFAASRAPVRAAFPWRQRSGFSTAEPPAGTRRSSKSWGWRSPVSLLLEIRTLPFAGFARRMRNDGPGCGTPPGFPLSGMARAATWAAAARLRNAQLS